MKACEVCGNEITKDQSYFHHQRLNVDIHMDCPADNVRGEDVSTHAMTMVLSDADRERLRRLTGLA